MLNLLHIKQSCLPFINCYDKALCRRQRHVQPPGYEVETCIQITGQNVTAAFKVMQT